MSAYFVTIKIQLKTSLGVLDNNKKLNILFLTSISISKYDDKNKVATYSFADRAVCKVSLYHDSRTDEVHQSDLF